MKEKQRRQRRGRCEQDLTSGEIPPEPLRIAEDGPENPVNPDLLHLQSARGRKS